MTAICPIRPVPESTEPAAHGAAHSAAADLERELAPLRSKGYRFTGPPAQQRGQAILAIADLLRRQSGT